MATQFVTYYLSSYKDVIEKSNAIKAVEGAVVIVKVKPQTFDDPANLYKREKHSSNYMLVAELPMSAAIKLC